MLYKAQINNYGLDDWVTEFHEIYGAVNKDRTLESVWLHAIEDASQLHEDLRIGEYYNALGHIADIFCWLCAFTMKARSDLGTKESLLDIVLCKYPRYCFYCQSSPCICSAILGRGIEDRAKKEQQEKDRLKRAAVARARLHQNGNEPKSLQEIIEMYRTIYDAINFRTPLEIIMAHLQEEVGEVASALNDIIDYPERRFSDEYRQKLEHEIADVVTWIVALVLKFDYLLTAGAVYQIRTGEIPDGGKLANYLEKHSLGITLSSVLWTRFQTPDGNALWCPNCKERPCNLKLFR